MLTVLKLSCFICLFLMRCFVVYHVSAIEYDHIDDSRSTGQHKNQLADETTWKLVKLLAVKSGCQQ